MDLAARFLSGYPGAQQMVVGVHERSVHVFRRNFAGRTRPIELGDADYWVFDVNIVQREHEIEQWGRMWQASQATEPLHVVSFDGVPYVWIYRAYPHEPAAFDIEHRVDAQLGEHVRLLGYRNSSSEISAGEPLTVTLFWQSDGRETGNYVVFVHLVDSGGRLVAQHDGVPVQEERPTWNWRDAEVIRDEHVIVLPESLSEDVYALFAGMYDWPTGERLPVVGSDARRLPDDRIRLAALRVALP
jgi:hypothetical protein